MSGKGMDSRFGDIVQKQTVVKLSTPELNPSAQSCLPRFIPGDFNF
jgi:hypothetical protein